MRKRKEKLIMKKNQLFIAALCVSALVLGSCTSPRRRGGDSSSSDQPSTSQSGTSQSGTSQGGTSQGGTSQGGTSQSGTSQGGTSASGTSQGGTSSGTSQGTSEGGTSSSSGATSGTSGVAPAPTDWSAEEKALLEDYVHTNEIPFLYVQGSVLYRDKDYACLTYGGGESSAELLEEYASMFDESWNIRATRGLEVDEYGLMYFGEKDIDFGGSPVTVSVSIYGYDEEIGVTDDGSGVFCVDFSDGLYYGWAEFAPLYQEVLDYFYDKTDESGNPVEFPGTVALMQDDKYPFIIEPENSIDEDGYYVIWVSDIVGEDIEAFMEAFEKSEYWEGYTDTINGLPAYHDSTGSIAIAYNDLSASGYAGFFIHAYEQIYYEWPGDDVASFIDTVNEATDVEVAPLNAGSYIYEAEGSEMVVYCFDDSLKSSDVDAYAAGLDSEVWSIVDKISDPVYGDYYVCYSYDWAITLQAFYSSYGYAVLAFDVMEPLEEAYPSTIVDALFSGAGIEVPAIPSYEIAGENAGFEISVGSHSVDAYVLGSNTIELSTFMGGLDSGWVLDPEQTKEGVSVYVYGDTLARLTVADRSKLAGARFIYIGFDIAYDWSDEQKALFETALHGVILPYFSGELTYVNSEEEGEYFYFIACENEAITEQFYEAYSAFSADETWTFDDYYFSFSKPTEDGGYVETYIDETEDEEGNVTDTFYIYYVEPAQTDWVEADYEYIDYCLGGIVPVFFEGSYNLIMAAWFGIFMSNNEFSEAQFADYAEASVAAGWEKVEEPLQVTLYRKWAEDESGYASFFYDMFGCIEFEYVQVDWKAAEKAEFIEKLHGIVPPYLEGGLYESTTHDFEGNYCYETADKLVAYLDEALAGDGWSTSGSAESTTYSKASSDGEGQVVIAVEYDEYYGYYWVIDFVANA